VLQKWEKLKTSCAAKERRDTLRGAFELFVCLQAILKQQPLEVVVEQVPSNLRWFGDGKQLEQLLPCQSQSL
jgi:hypothetical protein